MSRRPTAGTDLSTASSQGFHLRAAFIVWRLPESRIVSEKAFEFLSMKEEG